MEDTTLIRMVCDIRDKAGECVTHAISHHKVDNAPHVVLLSGVYMAMTELSLKLVVEATDRMKEKREAKEEAQPTVDTPSAEGEG